VDHTALQPILETLHDMGVPALAGLRAALAEYRDAMAAVDPDSLTRGEALAFWLNLYNAGALEVAADAYERREASVLRLPGAFQRPWATVAGEDLSLDDIEHGKLRRLGDPRIHGALVCGSASCPTLRYEPYRGSDVEAQLDDQLRRFLSAGGAVADRTKNVLALSRVFLWYGGDFVRPHRMPTWLPSRPAGVTRALRPWFDDDLDLWLEDAAPKVAFQPYDWSLACKIGT